MVDPAANDTFWVTLVNWLLAAVTLLCIVAVAFLVYRALVERSRKRRIWAAAGQNRELIARLGATMPDGGETFDRPRSASRNQPSDSERAGADAPDSPD